MSQVERSLNSFTIEDYGTANGQRDYIEALFKAKGVDFGDRPTYYAWSSEHSALVKSFFKLTGYGPETKLGQLVQLVACEDKKSIDIVSFSRKGKWDLVAQNDRDLAQIRRAGNQIAKEIFGGEADGFIDRIREDYIMRPPEPMSNNDRRKRRRTNLSSIISDVTTKFPLTSR